MLALMLTMQLIFYAVVFSFAVYVLLELRLVRLAIAFKGRGPASPSFRPEAGADFFPEVAVLLPVCNESAVIERLVNSVCRLQYPQDKLEILLLDDSNDLTSELARALVAEQAAAGLRIRYLNRGTRRDSKAGNLCFGAARTQAELLAVFDADFLPPPDFLLRTIPSFSDPQLGFLQTGISYENRDSSFLTRLQALEMEHHQFVTSGLSLEENMVSLSGSSCVWRRACLEAIGGWRATTVTEDVDVGYQAQIVGWKYAYLNDVVSASILPETVSAFRVQRERWGRGLMHNAFKHRRQFFQKKMPPLKRLHAVAMMFSSLLLAAIYALFLLSLPLTIFGRFEGPGFTAAAVGFFILVTIWALVNMVGSPEWDELLRGRNKAKPLACGYAYVAFFLPMSLYYFIGGLRVLCGGDAEFHRTPKGLDEVRAPRPGLDVLLHRGEIFSILYAAATAIAAVGTGNYILLPICLTAGLGFGMVLRWGARDERRMAAQKNRSILITGATGAIGSALAELYAGPGVSIYLQGRKSDRLESLAGICRAKGAQALAYSCDLGDAAALRLWLEEIKAVGSPDLLILAAGLNTNIGPLGQPEDPAAAEALIEVNLKGTMKVITALLPDMLQRGSGQIAIFSSLAAYFGLPLTPSYCASKAALKAYGESLRGWLAPRGLRVSVVMPGYVKSLMCDEMPGPKPLLLSPARAARIIRRGLEGNRARISFPFPLNWGTWFLAALPAALSHKILARLGYVR